MKNAKGYGSDKRDMAGADKRNGTRTKSSENGNTSWNVTGHDTTNYAQLDAAVKAAKANPPASQRPHVPVTTGTEFEPKK